MSSVTRFLGKLTDQTNAWREGALTILPVPATRAKAKLAIQAALEAGSLSSSEASKLRGLLQWLDVGLHGRPCRGALSALVARQYFDFGFAVSPYLGDALLYLLAAVSSMPGRKVPLFPRPRSHLVMYTDASTEGPTKLRVGILLMRRGCPDLVMVVDIPTVIQVQWQARANYIGLGELIAAPLACYAFQTELYEQDLIWFIDNVGAATCLIKAASPQVEHSSMALVAGLFLLHSRTRAWFEWLASAQSPADCLSRAGWDDPTVQLSLASGRWIRRDVQFPWDVLLGDFSALCSSVSALGS